ncbi:MAG: hypothetical protein ACC618_02745 [Patescibacteria group bacterium]
MKVEKEKVLGNSVEASKPQEENLFGKILETPTGSRYLALKQDGELGVAVISLDNYAGKVPKEGLYLPPGSRYKIVEEEHIIKRYLGRITRIKEKLKSEK